MKEEYALVQSWEGDMVKIPLEVFYGIVLPLGWHLVSIYPKS